MKKNNNALILIFGIIISLLSYIFDSSVKLFFNGLKIPLFDSILSIITNFGVVIVVMLVIPTIIISKNDTKSQENRGFSRSRKFRKFSPEIKLLWLAFLSAVVLSFIIKLIFLRQRPYEAISYPMLNILNFSFPSMHSLVVFALLPLLSRFLPKQKYFWVIFAFMVAFTRIYFGFHFLSDVVFGAFSGYFTGILILELNDKGKI